MHVLRGRTSSSLQASILVDPTLRLPLVCVFSPQILVSVGSREADDDIGVILVGYNRDRVPRGGGNGLRKGKVDIGSCTATVRPRQMIVANRNGRATYVRQRNVTGA